MKIANVIVLWAAAWIGFPAPAVVPAALPDPNIDKELAGYWTFDETTGMVAHDISSNGNHGDLMGGFSFDNNSAADRFDNPTGALTFNGSTDWVNILHSASLDCYPQVTMAAWIKVPPNGFEKEYATIIGKDLAIELNSNYRGWTLMVPTNLSVMAWCANSTWITYVGNITGTPGSVTQDVWHLVAATHDGTGITLYFDGVQDGDKVPMNELESTADAPLVFGKGPDEFSDRHWAGAIDEITIWNGALTAAEMFYLYQTQAPPPPLPTCRDLAGYWSTDLNQDCNIDLADFAILITNWLKCNDPEDPLCW
ncbi:MAG: hypothetical protein BWY71_01932 [Planctomycetes bacterium ADurb.Bin412]|nr:MAG: hypothetical protein BWY71_01932 [Planctomycetes bacterium ADurb.Bin412]